MEPVLAAVVEHSGQLISSSDFDAAFVNFERWQHDFMVIGIMSLGDFFWQDKLYNSKTETVFMISPSRFCKW